MKKLVSVVLSFALLLIISMPVSASGQQMAIDENHNHSGCSTEVIKEVPLTSDMLQQAQKMNVVPSNRGLVAPMASCTHSTYSPWTTLAEKYELPKTFGYCYVLVEYQLRYCKSCNASFAREKRTQLPHINIGNSTKWKCSRCGMVGGIASVGDLQDK